MAVKHAEPSSETAERALDALDTTVDARSGIWKKRIGRTAIVALGITLAATTAATYKIPKDMFFTAASTQEAQIAKAYNEVFDTNNAKVRCRTPQELGKYVLNGRVRFDFMSNAGFSFPHSNTMWLSSEICDGLSSIREIAPTHDNFADLRDANDGVDTYMLLMDVQTAAHEGEHGLRNTPKESKAECYGLQDAANLAVALGAPKDLYNEMGSEILAATQRNHSFKPETSLYRFDLNNCRKGGAQDLNLAQEGVFPTQP